VAWKVWYRDNFDREDPGRCEGEGTELIAGLARWWRQVLHEGIDIDGKATFSSFALYLPDGTVWGPGEFARRDSTLAKLRAWVFPPWPPAKPRPAVRDDACGSAPHEEAAEVLAALAAAHVRFAGGESAAQLQAGVKPLLAHIAALTRPSEI
jgi:hypothetical protein